MYPVMSDHVWTSVNSIRIGSLEGENSLVLKQFASGEQDAYDGLAGITFRGTSNPSAQVPEKIKEYNITDVNKFIMKSEEMEAAFPNPALRNAIPGVDFEDLVGCGYMLKN